MAKRIVISGYYGFGNTGDEAVLAGMLASFREVGLDLQVKVLSADPVRTVHEHPGVQAVQRWQPLSVIRAILSSDVLVSGGGSLIQDATSAVSAYYYLTVLRLAQLLKRKTVVYAQGVGPIDRPSVRRTTARFFDRAVMVTVRDPDSKELLESIGVRRAPIHLAADPAFLVRPDLETADRLIERAGLVGSSLIGVCLRPWSGPEGWRDAVCGGIARAAEQVGACVALIPMQEPEDMDQGDALGAKALSGSGRPEVVKGLVSRCDLIVGMRLHSLIFAAGEKVPFIPISYDPKVDSFARSAGAGNTLSLESLTSDEVSEAVVAEWNRRQETRQALAAEAQEWRRQALVSAELLKEVLN